MARPSPMLTLPEAAAYLRVSERTLYDWRWKRKGPPGIKVGSLVRYLVADLDEWLGVGAASSDQQ